MPAPPSRSTTRHLCTEGFAARATTSPAPTFRRGAGTGRGTPRIPIGGPRRRGNRRSLLGADGPRRRSASLLRRASPVATSTIARRHAVVRCCRTACGGGAGLDDLGRIFDAERDGWRTTSPPAVRGSSRFRGRRSTSTKPPKRARGFRRRRGPVGTCGPASRPARRSPIAPNRPSSRAPRPSFRLDVSPVGSPKTASKEREGIRWRRRPRGRATRGRGEWRSTTSASPPCTRGWPRNCR